MISTASAITQNYGCSASPPGSSITEYVYESRNIISFTTIRVFFSTFLCITAYLVIWLKILYNHFSPTFAIFNW